MITALFDDHYEAFVTWRENGLSGLTCIHVDAHLDVMSDGFNQESLNGIAQASNGLELARFRGNPRLPWGGFHCGNYLFPGLLDGTISKLIWVLPPHIIGGETFVDGVRQEAQNWLDLKLDEYRSLTGKDGAVEGTLEGCPFVVCTAQKIPSLSVHEQENLALDIDVDYFVKNSDDSIWQTPHQLFDKLGKPRPKVLTVAYSVDGGYTPLRHRYLGEVTREVFANQDSTIYRELTDRIVEWDSSDGETEELETLLSETPDFLKPALYLRLERPKEAIEIEPDYQVRFQNLVARFLIKKEHEQGLELLEKGDDGTPESLYLKAYLNLGKGDALEARRALSRLLDHPELKEIERSRVLILKANACLELGDSKEALKLTEEALSYEPDSAEIHYLQANAYRAAAKGKKAARSIRKALRLAKGRVSSLQMMLDAARIYDELGQAALAKSTRRELKELDVTGRYAIKTVLDASKL